ncbi:hypothetical protein E3P81_01844, partial [Wallemia ichthyophaga]
TSKQFNSQFNFHYNKNLYSSLFPIYFDLNAPKRRFHITASGISRELKERCIALKRFFWRRIDGVYDDDYLITDLLRLYLIVIESDLINIQYNNVISEYTSMFIHSDSFPSINKHVNSLILWLDYLINDKPSSITPYKPFLFAAHLYDSFYAPWPYSTLPSAEFDSQIDDPFLTDMSLNSQSITLNYFGSKLELIPPISSQAAFLTLYKFKNDLPKPNLKSYDFDSEFIRLSQCTNPSSSPGCHASLFQNHFQGAWEGFFCYYEFDDYRDILAGSIDTLYNGVHAIQPQVWRLNETLEDYRKPSSLSTLQDICGGHDDQHLSIKRTDDTRSTRSNTKNELLIQPETIDDGKEIHLNGLGHSAWGRFKLRGKVRAWDGMFMLCKEYTPDGRGKWFYRGYSLPGGVLVGRWRDTYTPEVLSGYEVVLERDGHENKAKYDLKYADKLSQRLRQEGVESLEELKKKLAPGAAAVEEEKPDATETMKEKHPKAAAVTPNPDQLKVDTGKDEYFVGSVDKVEGRKEGDGTGVKPLDSIINVAKMAELPLDHISKLWNAHHSSKDNYLSATIPKDTYEGLYTQARKYPAFVIPIPREVKGDKQEDKTGYEVFYLEWGFLPDTLGSGTRPSTLIFTSLNEYKQRQAFAQPFVSCTHYTDLAKSHDAVLMRGEVTAVQADDKALAVLDSKDAQLLILTMQRFYNAHKFTDNSSKDRAKLLHNFHFNQSEFDFDRLCALVEEI